MARVAKKQRGIFERPKGSGIWWIRYADAQGKIHGEKVGMKQTAINAYRKRKTEVHPSLLTQYGKSLLSKRIIGSSIWKMRRNTRSE